MAEIAAALVKDLREQTGAGMMECKKALVEAQGDLEKATNLLRERGLSKARGKLGRATSEGRIAASVSDDGRCGALVEVNCETDFVAKTAEFETLAGALAVAARESSAGDADGLLAETHAGRPLRERLVEGVSVLGENLQLRRLARLQGSASQQVYSYIHAGGKIGALVLLESAGVPEAELAELGRNLCMHVTATNPLGVSRSDLPADEVERERAVLAAQAAQEGKPANLVEKMVEGRLTKFFREVALLEQQLVMDPDSTVESALKRIGAKVVAFRRFQLGEAAA